MIESLHHLNHLLSTAFQMIDLTFLTVAGALAPATSMALASVAARTRLLRAQPWLLFHWFSALALVATFGMLASMLGMGADAASAFIPGLAPSLTAAWTALMVQLLGTTIGAFSARYLQGEAGQQRYVSALASVLAAVQLLLLADHWLVLIAAWSAVGLCLQTLLCFYSDRPFAMLAAHKKLIADRVSDVLLLFAAALAWSEVGSGSLSDLRAHLAVFEPSTQLKISAVFLVLAVILRTALLPVHGWLIQVMEAPTPVSALLHAGVVNLGGFVVIRFAPLVEAAPVARTLLVVMGLGTAVLAGLVMLTRVSIKVRLAWSTVAQMGFMLMECGLGLYTLAFLHLLGHSLYKAHSFLASSSVVRQSKLQALRGDHSRMAISLMVAPLAAGAIVIGTQALISTPQLAGLGGAHWPWWWSAVLALAWAPLLWLSAAPQETWRALLWQAATGVALTVGLTLIASLAHIVPFGVNDSAAPANALGLLALGGMTALYLCLVILQWRPQALETGRRWSYSGFYIDEFYTRLALRLFPGKWAHKSLSRAPAPSFGISKLTPSP